MSSDPKSKKTGDTGSARAPVKRAQLYISEDAYPELFEFLKTAGRYHGAKRLLRFAAIGLALENGNLPPPVSSLVVEKQKDGVDAVSKASGTQKTDATVAASGPALNTGDHSSKKYNIPESASDVIGDMLSMMESFEPQ